MSSFSLLFFSACPFLKGNESFQSEVSIGYSFADLTAVESSFSEQLISRSHSFALFCFSNYLPSFRLPIFLVLFPPYFIFFLPLSLSCIPATFSVYQSRQAHYDFISQTTLAVPFSECWLGAGRRFLKILIMEHGK